MFSTQSLTFACAKTRNLCVAIARGIRLRIGCLNKNELTFILKSEIGLTHKNVKHVKNS